MEDLSLILIKLSQKILNTTENSKLKLSKLLLNSLQSKFFTEGFLIEISTLSELFSELNNLYKEKFNENLQESYFYEAQLDERFIVIFKIIMDLALNGQRKEQFLNSILQMSEDQKNLLMEFAGEVVKRDFINFDKQDQGNFTSQLSSQNMLIQQKFIELKEQYSELQKKYSELLDTHLALKNTHQKNLIETSHLKQEKLELLHDLGLHPKSGYEDIIQKYRKEVSEFTKDTERLQRQVQQKNSVILTKQKQQQDMILSLSVKQQHLSLAYQQKASQFLRKLEQKDKKIEQLKQKEEEYRFQVVRLKQIIIDLRKQIEIKNAKLYQQEATIDKFNKMKKLHLQFRKQMIQNYRSGVIVNSPGGLNF